MDLATLIGLIVGLALIIGSMAMGAGLAPFINVPGLLIVIGGAFCGTLIRFPIGECFGAFGTAIKTAFSYKGADPYQLIDTVKEMADLARKKGMLALEEAEVPDPLLGKGIQMCVDGHDADFIKELLGKEITASIKRAEMGEKVFRAMGDAAPAFGMIGTLVGLVQMMATLSDPSGIGPAMAVSLLTTLYGAMLSNMFFLPIADKLAMRAEQEMDTRQLIVESVVGIREGTSPRLLEQCLKACLPNGENTKAANDGAEGEPAAA
ncbi:MotA/TolQ/ExbB proton channel family protein [Abyssibacter profundi]|uniref:Flagellar motor protein PomA n=1 Tax=Abyssibacter profundi TaxID=2182787 RepID=A0A363UQD8_9GAMM|nr:MotA/TolQ/ExbB proton channel family protein [Abyssibacter profundi]MBV59923.1 flagellar motor protein PomA [Nevskiales bacterium]PWN57702.1 flagellar motor protein PomA [Abyssibacter profundi]